MLRVHDVAAAADYLAVRAALNDEAQIESELRLSDALRWERQLEGIASAVWTVSSRPAAQTPAAARHARFTAPIAGRWPNATGAHR